MSIECYYGMCPFHDGDEPLCYEDRCKACESELRLYAAALKLQNAGYDLDELERDNPYSGWQP